MNESQHMREQKDRKAARERRFQSVVVGAVIPALLWWVGSTLIRVDKTMPLIDQRLQSIEIQSAGAYTKADAKVANDSLNERITANTAKVDALDDRVRIIEIEHAIERRKKPIESAAAAPPPERRR